MACKAIASLALAFGVLASGASAVEYVQHVPRNSTNCAVVPISLAVGRGVFNVSTSFVFVDKDGGTLQPEELARANVSVRR